MPMVSGRTKISIDTSPTLPRTIDGLELACSIIDDCFKIYFRDYHYMVPVLDPSITPNTYHQYAPFLFWVIISIGSRRYKRLPTLIQALAIPVTQLTLQSIILRSNPIERIRGLILLLNWPFPTTPFYRDPSFLLCGTLLNLAMQCGLHAPAFGQDFSKVYVESSEHEALCRAEMWAHVVIAYQR